MKNWKKELNVKSEHSEYEVFAQSSDANRRLLQEEELILDVTEALSEMLEREKVNKTVLAQKLGKTKGLISQILSGGRNLTLRTVADIADALGYRIRVVFFKDTRSTMSSPKECMVVPQTNFISPSWDLTSYSDWEVPVAIESSGLSTAA
jgi:transcriptional regulator with XRE-family HTH domain